MVAFRQKLSIRQPDAAHESEITILLFGIGGPPIGSVCGGSTLAVLTCTPRPLRPRMIARSAPVLLSTCFLMSPLYARIAKKELHSCIGTLTGVAV